MSGGQIAGLVLTGLGALLVSIGAVWFTRIRRFLATAVDVEGRVLGHQSRTSRATSGGSSTSYYPVVEFATAEGRSVQFADQVGGSPPSHEVGETVPVKYDPREPENARIATGFRLWFGPGLIGFLGLGFLVPGLIVLVAAS
jgi:hypothetical protein